jgi:hypothetical protein
MLSSTTSTRLPPVGAAGLLGLRNLADAGQHHTEERALAEAIAFDFYPSLMQIDQALDHRQADAQPSLAAVERALALGEELEHMRQQRFVDADAVVAHGD